MPIALWNHNGILIDDFILALCKVGGNGVTSAKEVVCTVFNAFVAWIVLTEQIMRAIRNTFMAWVLITEEVVCTVGDAPMDWVLIPKEVVCTVFNTFMAWVVLAEEVVCACINAFLSISPLKVTIKEVMCAIRNALPLNLTTKEMVGTISDMLTGWMSITDKIVSTIRNMAQGYFTFFDAGFFRRDAAFAAIGQVVTLRRHRLKLLNFPFLDSVQRFFRNAGVSDNFNVKRVRAIFLDSIVDSTAIRGSLPKMSFYAAR